MKHYVEVEPISAGPLLKIESRAPVHRPFSGLRRVYTLTQGQLAQVGGKFRGHVDLMADERFRTLPQVKAFLELEAAIELASDEGVPVGGGGSLWCTD